MITERSHAVGNVPEMMMSVRNERHTAAITVTFDVCSGRCFEEEVATTEITLVSGGG